MTICNMAVEAQVRAPASSRPMKRPSPLPQGRDRKIQERRRHRKRRCANWERRCRRRYAQLARERGWRLDAGARSPLVTWGKTRAGDHGHRPRPGPAEIAHGAGAAPPSGRSPIWVFSGGERITDIAVDRVFIGSCTNARIEDMRAVAQCRTGRTVNANVQAMIVPGSGLVKRAGRGRGLDRIFKAAGFDWREPGCSMCLAMNPDKLGPGERCASTSNRNFEGRQGHKGRTHLVSPAMAAAAAIAGRFVDVREWGSKPVRIRGTRRRTGGLFPSPMRGRLGVGVAQRELFCGFVGRAVALIGETVSATTSAAASRNVSSSAPARLRWRK